MVTVEEPFIAASPWSCRAPTDTVLSCRLWMGWSGRPVIQPCGLDTVGCVKWLTLTSGVARGPEGHLNALGGGCDVAGVGWDAGTRVQTRVQHWHVRDRARMVYILT